MIVSVPMPPVEGIGYYTWNLSRFLIGQGHKVGIVTRSQRGRPFHEVLDGISIWRPRFYRVYPFHIHLHGLFVQRLVQRLEGEVDILHFHTPLPPCLQTTRPVLLTVHSMVSADARAQRTESPVFDVLNRLQKPVSASIERRLFGLSDQITTVSGAAAQDMQSLLLDVGKSVEITWNGVNTDFFSPGDETPEPDTLLFVGRLAPGKGLADLIGAMAQVIQHRPGARLLIVGEGPLRGRIRLMIDQSGLARQIQLLGQVNSREYLRELYRKAWALILPSHHESMPTVVLEAMACGSPVVSTAVGSVPEVIIDGANGLLVSPRESEELAHTICHLLGNAGLRARLGGAARSTVEGRFSWRVVGSSYLRCYQALL